MRLRQTNVTVTVLRFGLGTQLSYCFTNLGAAFLFAPCLTARPDCMEFDKYLSLSQGLAKHSAGTLVNLTTLRMN